MSPLSPRWSECLPSVNSRAGEIQANLLHLNDWAKLSYLNELVAQKCNGQENEGLEVVDREFYKGEYERLRKELELALEESILPEVPSHRAALSDFLVR